MARHELIDGVAMNRQHPITFSVPSDGEKATIRPGDYVKVGFTVDSSIGQQERVWVQVQSVNHNKIVGVLDNDPGVCRRTLRRADRNRTTARPGD